MAWTRVAAASRSCSAARLGDGGGGGGGAQNDRVVFGERGNADDTRWVQGGGVVSLVFYYKCSSCIACDIAPHAFHPHAQVCFTSVCSASLDDIELQTERPPVV